jgi:hypothetical protein
MKVNPGTVAKLNDYRGNYKTPFLSAPSISPSAPRSRPASFWHSLSTPLKLQNWRFATGSIVNQPEKQAVLCFSG